MYLIGLAENGYTDLDLLALRYNVDTAWLYIKNYVLKNPDIAADIETKILQKLGIGQPKSDATAPVADLAERRPA